MYKSWLGQFFSSQYLHQQFLSRKILENDVDYMLFAKQQLVKIVGIKYAQTKDADLDIPAWQCTKTFLFCRRIYSIKLEDY